jgi:hypothetical protein
MQCIQPFHFTLLYFVSSLLLSTYKSMYLLHKVKYICTYPKWYACMLWIKLYNVDHLISSLPLVSLPPSQLAKTQNVKMSHQTKPCIHTVCRLKEIQIHTTQPLLHTSFTYTNSLCQVNPHSFIPSTLVLSYVFLSSQVLQQENKVNSFVARTVVYAICKWEQSLLTNQPFHFVTFLSILEKTRESWV